MLTLEKQFLDQILDHLQRCYPLEGCGLLAGTDSGKVTAVYPIDNILHSPTAYEMDPRQQIQAMIALEAQGWQLVGIYHSHPQGPAHPSATDIALAYYPEAVTIIVSLQNRDSPNVQAFRLVGQTAVEETLKMV